MMNNEIRNRRYIARALKVFFIAASIPGLFITHLFAAKLDLEMQDLEKAEKIEQVQAPEVIIRPKVEYRAREFRSPFLSPFYVKVDPAAASQQAAQAKQAQAAAQEKPLPSLKIQGLIWGGDFPQAIVNDKVVKIGDTIEGARVLSINKEGIELFFEERKYKLPSPAAGYITGASDKKP